MHFRLQYVLEQPVNHLSGLHIDFCRLNGIGLSCLLGSSPVIKILASCFRLHSIIITDFMVTTLPLGCTKPQYNFNTIRNAIKDMNASFFLILCQS